MKPEPLAGYWIAIELLVFFASFIISSILLFLGGLMELSLLALAIFFTQ